MDVDVGVVCGIETEGKSRRSLSELVKDSQTLRSLCLFVFGCTQGCASEERQIEFS